MIRSLALLASVTATLGQAVDCDHWLCFCEAERYAVCEEPDDKGKAFSCLRTEVMARNEGFSPGCTEAVAKRAGIDLNSFPPECGQTGWKCTCEPELMAACSDVDEENMGELWGCLTTYATSSTGGIQSKECQDSIEKRLALIRQSQMASLVKIPSQLLTDLLTNTCRSSYYRLRSGAGKPLQAKCLGAEKSNLLKCNDDDTNMLYHVERANKTDVNSGFMVMQIRENMPFCLSGAVDFKNCFENQTEFTFERLGNQALNIKHDGQCLTNLGKKVAFSKCAPKKQKKAAKKQTWFVEPVFAASPVASYDNAGALLSRTLSEAMSNILSKEVEKMERAMYGQMVQQMEYMLEQAGLDLYDGVAMPQVPGAPPVGPPGPPGVVLGGGGGVPVPPPPPMQ